MWFLNWWGRGHYDYHPRGTKKPRHATTPSINRQRSPAKSNTSWHSIHTFISFWTVRRSLSSNNLRALHIDFNIISPTHLYPSVWLLFVRAYSFMHITYSASTSQHGALLTSLQRYYGHTRPTPTPCVTRESFFTPRSWRTAPRWLSVTTCSPNIYETYSGDNGNRLYDTIPFGLPGTFNIHSWFYSISRWMPG